MFSFFITRFYQFIAKGFHRLFEYSSTWASDIFCVWHVVMVNSLSQAVIFLLADKEGAEEAKTLLY